MTRRSILMLCALALIVGSCGRLGLGEASCVSPQRDISSANILAAEAVPTARYTPCIDELRLGWDSVESFASSGRAGIEIEASGELTPFLVAYVTAGCDTSGAAQVESGHPDIERFENIDRVQAEIGITVVPIDTAALAQARILIDELGVVEIDNRPVVYTLDETVDELASIRVERALRHAPYIWILSGLDAQEGRLELRSPSAEVSGRGLTPDEALELIEDSVPDVHYRGNWYFTFDGGCITYEFEATGTLAETVAEDVEQSLGFYPAYELRQVAEDAGFYLGD